MLTVSVVLFDTHHHHLNQLCESLLISSVDMEVFFVNNAGNDELREFIPDDPRFTYLNSGRNIGYGSGHNLIIEDRIGSGEYHLVINPDVYFPAGTLEAIMDFMDKNRETGLLLPEVYSPDGSLQLLYKLLPSPADLFVRRFVPDTLKVFFSARMSHYEMKFADASSIFEAPYLSGCFMFIRKAALKNTGGFDSRFFLYCEDIDLSRRINLKWKTVYFPKVHIYHYFQKGSYKKLKLLFYHTCSAIKYFNKYGWFEDLERKQVNRRIYQSWKSKRTDKLS